MLKLQTLLKTGQYAGGIFCRYQSSVSATQKIKDASFRTSSRWFSVNTDFHSKLNIQFFFHFSREFQRFDRETPNRSTTLYNPGS